MSKPAKMQTQPCESCGTTTADRDITTIPGVGVVLVCNDPTACRLRAQAAGVWCRYEPAGVGR